MEEEVGHIANLTSQLRQILHDIRIQAMKYYDNAKADFRKCSYCGLIWQLIEGCKGETECGARPQEKILDLVENGKMANFLFTWNENDQVLETEKISINENFPMGQESNSRKTATNLLWP